jgi:hypothetical protein
VLLTAEMIDAAKQAQSLVAAPDMNSYYRYDTAHGHVESLT